MDLVFQNGLHESGDSGLVAEVSRALEMESFLHVKTQHLAKGQLQRSIIGLSLLYGSRIIMMDEPVFALEEGQKDRVFEYLLAYSRSRKVPLYYTVHNLDLSRKYSDFMLLFTKEGGFSVGTTGDMFTRERIEEAFHAPMDTLHQRDSLYRELLLKNLE
ncbi:MAG: hypothetical protein E4H09_04175 [Spirochaetales bacterium]|nr:MAG: hypothetical protein E4H09_04175 [Spirochaetales bacterium]